MNSLVKFWNECDLGKPPYIHPQDLPIVDDHPKLFDKKTYHHRSFIRSARFGKFEDNRFHMSLLPTPYGGNLEKAKIFVLLLNPGFGLADYHFDAVARKWNVRSLRQQLNGVEFPFTSLNPELCWRPGFGWWEKKLRSVISRIADERFEGNYLHAMRDLSAKLALIELVPYHSSTFHAQKVVKMLPSVRAAKDYVVETLLPKARGGEVTIIVTRKVREWGLPIRHVIAYEGGQARGAHLGVNSKGGKAILKAYGLRA